MLELTSHSVFTDMAPNNITWHKTACFTTSQWRKQTVGSWKHWDRQEPYLELNLCLKHTKGGNASSCRRKPSTYSDPISLQGHSYMYSITTVEKQVCKITAWRVMSGIRSNRPTLLRRPWIDGVFFGHNWSRSMHILQLVHTYITLSIPFLDKSHIWLSADLQVPFLLIHVWIKMVRNYFFVNLCTLLPHSGGGLRNLRNCYEVSN